MPASWTSVLSPRCFLQYSEMRKQFKSKTGQLQLGNILNCTCNCKHLQMTKHDKNSSQVKSKTCPKTTAYHSGSCRSFSLPFALAPTSQLRNHDTSYVFESPVFLVNLEASYPTYSPENCLYKGSSNFHGSKAGSSKTPVEIKIPKSLLSDLRDIGLRH